MSKKPAAKAATRKPASVPTAAPVNTQSAQWRRVEQLATQLQQAIAQMGGGGAPQAGRIRQRPAKPAKSMAAGAATES